MKKVFCITIALCLVFASVLPVYADAWTSQQANNVNLNVQNIYQYLRDFLLSYNSGQTSDWTFGDLYWEIHRIGSWLAPIGSNDGSFETIWSALLNIAIDTRSYLPQLPAIASYVSSWMTSNNNYLAHLNVALSNDDPYHDILTDFSLGYVFNNSHWTLLEDRNGQGGKNGYYAWKSISNAFNPVTSEAYWQHGSPIGNVALLLASLNNSFVNSFAFNKSAFYTHYNDNLTTWDSQGSTLTQVAFTPDSAIHGLYRYLAFTQRDVARLAYVFANDEELEARELAQANQEQVLDDFIDPNGFGSVSPTDLGNMTDASDGFKSNFSTNVGSSHIWDVFDNSRYNWFTQQTKNQLDTTPQTRTLKAVSNDYPTPLLDNYYNEIFGIIGVDVND